MVSASFRLVVGLFWLLLVPSTANARQVTPTPIPASEVDEAGTREVPYLPHTAVPLSDDWTIVVVDITPDAEQMIMAENQFNDPPEPGTQFFVARISATYKGSTSDQFDASYRLRVVGPTSVSYSTFENSCGVIPDEITSAEVFAGGTIEGNVCWAVKDEDAEELVMYDNPFTFDDVERVFLSLDKESLD
jgi:hypothetical protein